MECNSPYCDVALTVLVMSSEALPVLDVNPDYRRKDASNKCKETNILIGSPRFFCVASSYKYMLTINSSTHILKHHVICRFHKDVFFTNVLQWLFLTQFLNSAIQFLETQHKRLVKRQKLF